MNENITPQGEYHHFQLVNSDGDIPLSISVMVHYNRREDSEPVNGLPPISTNDIIEFHEALKGFDGNFAKAFRSNS